MGLGIQVNLKSEVNELESQLSCDQLHGIWGAGSLKARGHEIEDMASSGIRGHRIEVLC